MKSPKDEVIKKLVGDWQHKADQDFAAAKALFSQETPLLYPSCFHAQQAAEKYIKAYLTWKQTEFPKTHSINELLNLVKVSDEELASELNPATALTPFGVDIRYPSDAPEPDLDEARQALELVQMVSQRITDMLPKL